MPIIQVLQSSTLPQIHYLAATNESDTALIIVPDIGQNVNAGLQMLVLNNEFPSWALDWPIVPNAPLTLPDYAEILAAWLQELALCQYQIVVSGTALSVVIAAVQTYGLHPQRIIALDPSLHVPNYNLPQSTFTSYEALVLATHQYLHAQTLISEFQTQMMVNAYVAQYHQVQANYQVRFTTQQQAGWQTQLQALQPQRISVPLILLASAALQKQINQQEHLQQAYQQWLPIFDQSYVLQNTAANLLLTAPLGVLSFLNYQ